jgi:trehalose 6-phosphate phosphatase
MLNGGLKTSWMNGRKFMPEYLFNYDHEIFKDIDRSDETFLFLDYDGTLVSFKGRPQEVITPPEVKIILSNLLKLPKFRVFIVSGRMLHEIKHLLSIKGLSFAALHGLQIELSNGKNFFWEQAQNIRILLEEIKQTIFNVFKNEKRLHIEDKEFTLAFHYRLLPNDLVEETVEKFENIIKKFDTNNILNLIYGSKVVEIRPKGWDKGKAVELILNNVVKSKNTLPIYIGDDTTDEDAFKQIEKTGITIIVTNKINRPTFAKYWLKDTDDVLIFLKSLSTIK